MSAGSRTKPFEEGLQLFDPQPLDIEGAARDEVDQVFDPLERTGEFAGAAAHHRLGAGAGGLARQRRLQRTRAVGWKFIR